MKLTKIFSILFIFIALLSISNLDAGSYNPHLKWKTMETDHFLIHYPSHLRRIALKMGWIAEDVYYKLTPFMRWSPVEKTHVVLIDNTDMANGYTTFLPRNRVEIFLVPPPLESSLQNYDDWLYLVFTHEFTHVLHIDQHGGLASIFRELFGRNFITPLYLFPTLPVMLFPSWIHESIAVYNETRFTTGGRGRSTFADMVVYTALLEKNFPSLAQLITPPPQWPYGYTPYIFGEKFLSYLIKKHGLKSLYRSFVMERNFIFPFWMELLHISAFHQLAELDYVSWQKYMRRHARRKRWKLYRRGIKFYTDPMWEHTVPICDNGDIIYLKHTGYMDTRIVRLNPRSKKETTLVKGYTLPYISVDDTGNKIVYSKLEFHNRYNLFADLYVYDTRTSRERRLTRGARLHYPTFLNGYIYALQITYGGVRLYKLSENGEVEEIDTIPDVDNAGFLRPYDEDSLLMSVHHGNSINIAVYDLKEKKLRLLTGGHYIDMYPVRTEEGIIFSSNRDGRGFNLYLLRNGRIEKLTRGFGGYFKATVCGDHIYSDLYTSKGYRIARIPERWVRNLKSYNEEEGPQLHIEQIRTLTARFPERNYNPFANMLPTSVYPYLLYDRAEGWRAGLQVSGSDVLNFISYQLKAEENITLKQPFFQGWLLIEKFNPDIALGGGRILATDTLSTERFFTFQLQNSLPSVNSFSKTLLFTYSYSEEVSYPEDSKGFAMLSFLYDSARSYPEIMRPNDGSSLGLSMLLYTPFLGTPYVTWGVIGDFRNYLPISSGAQLITQLYGGFTGGDGYSDIKIYAYESFSANSPLYFKAPTPYSFNFAGYTTDEVSSSRLVGLSTTLSFRIARLNDGIGTIPLWFGELWSELYTQHVIFKNGGEMEYAGNVGLAVDFNFVIGHLLPIYLKLAVTYRIPDDTFVFSPLYISMSPF